MQVSFTIISNVAVTTRVSINKKGMDLFVKAFFKTGANCLIYVEIKKRLSNCKIVRFY